MEVSHRWIFSDKYYATTLQVDIPSNPVKYIHTMTLSLTECLAGKHDTELNVAICEWNGWKSNGAGAWHKNGKVCRLEAQHFDDCGGIGGGYTPALPSHIDGPEALWNVHLVEHRLSLGAEGYGRIFRDKLMAMYKPWPEMAVSADARQRVIAILQTVKPDIFKE